VKVTEQNYAHFVQKFKPSDVATIAARWAVNAPAVVAAPVIEQPSNIISL
jgi:hypothetical protein